IRDSVRQIFGKQFHGDYVISVNNFGFGGLPPKLADQLNKLPEVGTATGVGVNYVNENGKGKTVSVVDPATAGALFDLGFTQGSLSDLTPTGVLVSKGKADKDGLELGSTLTLTLPDGTDKHLTVQGIYKEDDLAGPVTVDRRLFDNTKVDQYDFAVYMTRA